MATIRVLIADDHQLFIDGIASLLKEADGIEVVATALNGEEVLEKLSSVEVDVALMDISMPGKDGIETTAFITETYPAVKVVALSAHNQVPFIVRMLKAGAKGYMLKHISKADLVDSIELVHGGGIYYSPEVAVHLVTKLFKEGVSGVFPVDELSPREVEIVKLIVKGEANKTIADQLFISEATVKTHRQRILHKLNLKNTSELIKYAYQKNIF